MRTTTKKTIVTKLSHHNFQLSNVDYLEKVLKNELRKLSRPQRDDMSDININAMIYGIFISATVKATAHLGQKKQENLRTTKNTQSQTVVRCLAEIDPGPQK